MPDPDLRPKRRDGVRSETVEGEIVLYDPTQGQAVYLNETAALIWTLCDGNSSVREMTALLQREMGDTAASIATDVDTTIDRFLEANLVG
jgi:hypothetical protein